MVNLKELLKMYREGKLDPLYNRNKGKHCKPEESIRAESNEKMESYFYDMFNFYIKETARLVSVKILEDPKLARFKFDKDQITDLVTDQMKDTKMLTQLTDKRVFTLLVVDRIFKKAGYLGIKERLYR